MRTAVGIIFLSLVLMGYCGDPLPPAKTWPPVWHTWVVTTVIKDNETQPLYNKGQLIAYDANNKYSCRYNQQELVNLTSTRALDVCDYSGSTAYHWALNDTIPYSTCSESTVITGPIPRISYPSEFYQSNKYIGIDKVNQLYCNHWISQISPTQQLDVWASVDTGNPCQLSVYDQSTSTHTTWAFDGFNTFIPDQAANQCGAAKLSCAEPDWTCNVKANVSDSQLIAAIGWVCNPVNIDCSPINPGGNHYEPNTLIDHSNWAFNEYYVKERARGGNAACDFGGIAELVPPAPQPPSYYHMESSIEVTAQVFLYDVVCPKGNN